MCQRLATQRREFGVQPYHVTAMQTLRLEKGYRLYGNDVDERWVAGLVLDYEDVTPAARWSATSPSAKATPLARCSPWPTPRASPPGRASGWFWPSRGG
jgi:hypothetical protein